MVAPSSPQIIAIFLRPFIRRRHEPLSAYTTLISKTLMHEGLPEGAYGYALGAP